MWPRREAEILPKAERPGGSLYWVIKGLILVRQPILAFQEERGEDGIRRCALVLDPALVRVEARPRSAFQGWRYLPQGDAPRDIGPWRTTDPASALPGHLEAALSDLGVLSAAS